MFDLKSEFRQFFLKKRLNLEKNEFKIKSLIIQKKLYQFIQKKNLYSIASYFSYKNEVNLTLLHKNLLYKRKLLLFPHVHRLSDKKMEFFKLDNLKKDIIKYSNHFKQIKKKEKINPNEIQCMLIPAIVFNWQGYRIGYGQGFYDRFLKQNNKILKIGICFDFQIQNFYEDIWDVKMDMLLSENFFLKF